MAPDSKPASLSNAEIRRDRFYRSLIPNGTGLCFDIGANIGNRLSSFRRLGLRVVALEPQTQCHVKLVATFANDPDVTLIKMAVGSAPGRATMMLSDLNPVLSSLSREFIDATRESGRFGSKDIATWTKTEEVEVTTLDDLITRYGAPDFAKIDVEGYELEVVRGLSRPLPMLALEWAPEMTDNLLGCCEHLESLGPVSYNLSWIESMLLSRKRWMDFESLRSILNVFREEAFLFADIYVRSENGGGLKL